MRRGRTGRLWIRAGLPSLAARASCSQNAIRRLWLARAVLGHECSPSRNQGLREVFWGRIDGLRCTFASTGHLPSGHDSDLQASLLRNRFSRLTGHPHCTQAVPLKCSHCSQIASRCLISFWLHLRNQSFACLMRAWKKCRILPIVVAGCSGAITGGCVETALRMLP